jgi:hypothetical protein
MVLSDTARQQCARAHNFFVFSYELEVTALLAIFRTVKQCSELVHSTSDFSDVMKETETVLSFRGSRRGCDIRISVKGNQADWQKVIRNP